MVENNLLIKEKKMLQLQHNYYVQYRIFNSNFQRANTVKFRNCFCFFDGKI